MSEVNGTVSARGVATDTRCDLQGKIFVALRGERFDGHAYIDRAIEAGASVVVVDRLAPEVKTASESYRGRVCLVGVDDTLVALGELARFHRERWHGKLCCVVGSAGKTTTRTVTSSLLEVICPGRVHGTIGNLNNRIGVPMILLGLLPTHDFAVVELGTNQPGEVAALGRITTPDVAVLTLIDLEHTEGLGDLDGVEREERAVFDFVRPGGTKVGYGEDERVLRSLGTGVARRIVTYGFEESRSVRIVARRLTEDLMGVLEITSAGQHYTFETSLIGRPGALAAAAGIGAVEALLSGKLTSEACGRALRRVGEPGRNQPLRFPGGRIVVDDTYNSNPASVPSSIATGEELAELSGGRLWLVLGEMLELGELSVEAHRRLGRDALGSRAVGLIFVQGDARFAAEEARERGKFVQFFSCAADVAPVLAPLLDPSDVVVVKASRGVRAERVVEGLAAHFQPGSGSERAIRPTDREP